MVEIDLVTGVRFLGAILFVAAAIVVAFVHRGRVRSAVYERSRWLVVTASMLLGIHNILQFFGHYREESFTLCWAINLAFYVVVTPLYNMAELNLLRAGRNMGRRYCDNAIFIIICYTIFAIGFYTGTIVNDTTPWQTATFGVATCYFLKLFELSATLRRDMQTADRRLTDEELEKRHNILRYTAKSMTWVIFFSLVTPWTGMAPSLLLNSLFGLIVFGLLLWFIVQFVRYGSNVTELFEVSDEITEAEIIEALPADSQPSVPSSEVDHQVWSRIERWVKERRYTNPHITISAALEEMDVTVTALNFYLERNTRIDGYRKWLPYLRIEEAKRLMLEHPEYSLETIADACGYSCPSSLSRAFRNQEGMPPGQWLAAQNNH